MSSKSCWTPSELASALCHVSWLVTILFILWMNTWTSDSANCSSTQIIRCCGLTGGYYSMLWQPTVAHFAGGKYGHIVTAQVNLGLTDTSLEHHAFYCFNLTGADSVRSPEIEQWPSKHTFSKEDLDLGMFVASGHPRQ
jgi:hypothetical protein